MAVQNAIYLPNRTSRKKYYYDPLLEKGILNTVDTVWSNSVVDSSPSNHTITMNGGVAYDTSEKKIGNASIKFDGIDDYLTMPGTTVWEPGEGEFCYEMWYLSESSSGSSSGLGYLFQTPLDSSSYSYINFRVLANGTIKSVVGWGDGSANGYNGDQLADVNVHDGQWHHLALSRDNTSDTIRLYVDGVNESTYDLTAADLAISGGIDGFANYLFHIGTEATSQLYPLKGYLDEIRISNVARYTENFTPPTRAFVNDNNTKLLIHSNYHAASANKDYQGVCFCPSNNKLYVTSINSSTNAGVVDVICPSSIGTLDATITVGDYAKGIVYCPSVDRIFVMSQDNVLGSTPTASGAAYCQIINPRTNIVENEIQLAPHATTFFISPS